MMYVDSEWCVMFTVSCLMCSGSFKVSMVCGYNGVCYVLGSGCACPCVLRDFSRRQWEGIAPAYLVLLLVLVLVLVYVDCAGDLLTIYCQAA
jgi:hypothetical protein